MKVSRVIMKSGFIAVFGEILDWCCGRQSDGGGFASLSDVLMLATWSWSCETRWTPFMRLK